VKRLPARYLCSFVLLLSSPIPAWALCCVGDANVIESAATGIGQRQPTATDLSLDPRWRVHAFERDAVSYYQVSDSTGELTFIIGNAGDQFWLLPAGASDTVVRLPSDSWEQAPVVGTAEVYRDLTFRLLVSGSAASPVWWVESLPDLP